MSRNPKLASLGVNAVGYLRGGLGLGQAARLYVEALDAAGVPVRTTTVDVDLPAVVGPDGRHAQVKTTDFADLHVEGELPFNLVCVNAPELPGLHAQLGPEFFADRYTIGVWAWEVDVVPASWDGAFGLVDEIWVYSRYVQEIISAVSPVPVVRVPLPIVAPPAGGDVAGLELPDGFQFLFLFDFYSTLARKNPLGLVEAFTRAFTPGEGPQLVLKSHNGDFKPERLAALREAAGDRPDIHILDRFLSAAEMAALMRRADCYVSLHRAEGFGLTLGEMMALGKPVIATGFSSNLDFMTAENSYLVRHRETLVGSEGESYPARGTWAEPDLDHAAQLMREVWRDQAQARARGARAREEIAGRFSLEAVGQAARNRLKRLAAADRRRQRASSRPAADGDNGTRGLVNSWVETAEMKLSFDPARDARETGGPKGAARRAALAAMRPYTHHQNELSRFTVKALRELDERLDDLALDTQSQIARLQALVQRSLTGARDRPALRFDAGGAPGGPEEPLPPDAPVLELDGAGAAAGLRALDDGSVPALHAAQLVEQLDPDQLAEVLELMRRKLAPGGVAVIDAVNPLAEATRSHPLVPEALLALCRLAGFHSGAVRFARETGDHDADLVLNRDYAVVVRTAG
jgi:glycosyltransferase involved in cell wall biosynthesis